MNERIENNFRYCTPKQGQTEEHTVCRPTEAQLSETINEIGRLGELTECLNGAVARMDDKLQYILLPQNPNGCAETKQISPPRSEMAETLDNIGDRIVLVISRLNELTDRIDL